MNQEEIFEKVRTIIATELGVKESDVTKDAHFVYDLGADSLDWIYLSIAIGRAFDIDIANDKTAKQIYNLRQAVEFITKEITKRENS
jgi:acyl carrier protein